MVDGRKKVAVIGGGVGAITATYAITTIPDWDKHYDITIYQLGWRCGGKGASGRNADHHGRIEEHGLHIWAGFYENAFRLMRDCYDTLNKTGLRPVDAPLGTLEKAFKGLSHFFLAEDLPQPDGSVSLHPWRVDFQPNANTPGTGGVLPTPFAYFQMLVRTVTDMLDRGLAGPVPAEGVYRLPEGFHSGFQRLGLSVVAASPFHHLRALADRLSDNPHDHTTQATLMLAALAAQAQDWHTARMASAEAGDEVRRIGYMISLSCAFFRGAIDSGLFRAGFDAIDNWEISAWLLHYGASQEAVYSAVFRGCYDYVFGYPGGVTEDRGVGAGTAIRGLLRLAFTYKGALFYKMQAGMGDTIFGPYYQVLKSRGVKFRFFTAARALHLGADKLGIDAIDMVEQAGVISGDYQPLVDVKGLPCWPSQPDLKQLVPGSYPPGIDFECEKEPPTGRAFRLERGRDFDQVILGASLGSIPYLAGDLIDASPRWRAMVQNVGTVATHAAQFWLTRTAEELGWNALVAQHNPGPQTGLKTVITSFTEPLDTWADMTDLIPHEDWPEDGPTQLAYFCSPAHNAGVDPGPFADRVRDWADRDLTRMWPGAAKGGKFDLSLLWAEKGQSPEDAFRNQYFRQNFYGSERYVLSVPNSVQYRLPPDNSGFENLFLAGDWTRCGINAGCVEAATISGLVAARGLTGHPFEVVGESDLLPDNGPSDNCQLASPYAQTAPWPLTSFFGTGAVDGWFSFHAVDATALQAILPPGMTLAPQSFTPAGTHPVTILANRQIGVRASALPRFLGFRDYLEAIISVACVQVEGQPGLFNYLPNLYLSNRAAQLSGVWFYGFDKRMGKLAMGDTDYSVATPDGTPVWSARYQDRGFARSLFASPEAARVQTLCDQVIVTQGKFSRWQFQSFDFSLGTAEITPVAAEIDITNATLAELPAGRMVARPLAMPGEGTPPAPGLPGAFRIRTSWTLSNPLDSRRIAQLEAARSRLP
ncbi:MAG: NAD(P)-binding protein [Rhodobacterales bacterium]|nr:NAD(P)-binding protein [Rhodobacterales bacterium]